MSTADVQRLLLTDLRVVARITALLGGRLAEVETRLSDTVLKPVAARICSTLATLAGSPPAPVRPTHDQLADLVGTTRETTTKVLGDLRARNYVRLRRGRIDVLDPVAVLELAAGNDWPSGKHTTSDWDRPTNTRRTYAMARRTGDPHLCDAACFRRRDRPRARPAVLRRR